MMKVWQLGLRAVWFVASFSLASGSVENPGIRNPAGDGTIPPSRYRSGLVRSPNPIDPTGNLLMTGNVRRGMHFRGSVPYRSTTSFGATLGSSALDSFLRDTAGSEDFQDRSNKYRIQPFYSPTRTITMMVPGRSEVFSPMGMRIDDRVRQGSLLVSDGLLGLEASPPMRQTQDIRLKTQDLGLGSEVWSLKSEDEVPQAFHTEHLVPGQLGIRQERKASPKAERDASADKSPAQIPDADSTRQDLETDSDQVSESGFVDLQQRQRLPSRDDLTQYPGEEMNYVSGESSLVSREVNDETRPLPTTSRGVIPAKAGTRYEMQDTRPVSGDRRLKSEDQSEVLEQVRQQLDALTKSVEAGLRRRKASPKGEDASRVSRGSSLVSRTTKGGTRDTRHETRDTSLVSFSQSRFNLHISAAEDHLKAGRYSRAVDCFTLASIYQPDNPIVLAGKGHALFAAGEYMSSALFLARALTVRPNYPQMKVDLAAMLGGADKLAARITDVEQWLARSGSAQLQFLLSYVYFRTGRLNQAKLAIDAAYEKMPESPAVGAMRTAINQAAR